MIFYLSILTKEVNFLLKQNIALSDFSIFYKSELLSKSSTYTFSIPS